LATGARGWLPTNYCDAYEPEDMRSLLKALLNFWDLLRSASVNNEIFRNQEFMKGVIAGVRFLLVGLRYLLPHKGSLSLLMTMCSGTHKLLKPRIDHHSAQ